MFDLKEASLLIIFQFCLIYTKYIVETKKEPKADSSSSKKTGLINLRFNRLYDLIREDMLIFGFAIMVDGKEDD